jgi:hypothetical protein
MKTVTSISGGKTSAYLAANYPSDKYVFALVRTDDESCRFKDRKLAQLVEDRIQKPFIGTLEDDVIIHTIFDLEQYIGTEIDWVSGMSFDDVINGPNKKGGWLPNKLHRYCTTWMKLDPIFYWWHKNFEEPIYMQLGYRSSEVNRAIRMNDKLNDNGLLEHKATFEKYPSGRKKWVNVEWQSPTFPLIKDMIERQDIEKYWKGKSVRFAKLNNCIGCFHRSASLLNEMSKLHPDKFDWFIKQEDDPKRKNKDRWKSYLSYKKIKESNFTMNIPFDYDSEGCDSGFCGI